MENKKIRKIMKGINKDIMKNIVYILIALTFVSFEARTQAFNPTNTNFESMVVTQDSIPYSWAISNKSKDRGYSAKLTTEARSGKFAMLLSSTKEGLRARDFGQVDQDLSADAYLGKKIEFSAYLKTKLQGNGSRAVLWIKVFYADHKVQDFVGEDINTSAEEWKQYKVTADIGLDAVRITYGFQLNGEGQVWIDDVSFAQANRAEYSSLSLSDAQKQDLLDYAKFASRFLFYYPDPRLAYSDLRSVCEIGVNAVLNGTGQLTDRIKSAFPFADKLRITNGKKKNGKSNKKGKNNKNNGNNHNTINTIDLEAISDTLYPGFRMYHGFYNIKQHSRFSSRFQNYFANFRENPGQLIQRIGTYGKDNNEYIFQVFMKYVVVGEQSKSYAALTFRDEANQIISIKLPELIRGKDKRDWLELSAKGSIPAGCASVDITLFLDGEGTALFEDASFKVDGEELVKNGDFEEFTLHWAEDEKGEAKGYHIVKNIVEKRSGYASLEIKIADNEIAHYPKLSDYIEVKLGNVAISFPNVDMYNTRDSADILNMGNAKYEAYQDFNSYQDFNNPISRISAVIYTWAFLDNFSMIKVDSYAKAMDKVLLSEIDNASKAKSIDDLLRSLKRVGAMFPDNAIRFWSDEHLSKNLSSLPILLKFIDDDLYVYNSIMPEIPRGSKVSSINNEPIKQIIARERQYVSALSDGFAKSIIAANISYSYYDKNDTFNIEVNGKNSDFILSRNSQNMRKFSFDIPADTMLEDGIYYIDLTRHNDQSISKLFKEINKNVKGIIFDLRGYTAISEYFFKYFRRGKFKDVVWGFPYFFKHGEASPAKRSYSAKISGLGTLKDVKIVTLCDERTIGLAESHLHLLKMNGIGKSLGTASSGAPTEPAVIPLPCGMSMSASAIFGYENGGNNNIANDNTPKTLLGKQFIPDIIVKQTPSGIISGSDPLINQSLEILKSEINK